jgi:hypothetical protein
MKMTSVKKTEGEELVANRLEEMKEGRRDI